MFHTSSWFDPMNSLDEDHPVRRIAGYEPRMRRSPRGQSAIPSAPSSIRASSPVRNCIRPIHSMNAGSIELRAWRFF